MIDRSLKVAMPAAAATVVVPLKAPPPGLVPIPMVTLALLVVRFPNASTICTVTAGLIATPAVALLGCCRNASALAPAAMMLNPVEVAPVRPVLLAVSV